MSSSNHSARQIEQLLQNLEDCSLTGAEHAELMDLLRRDPEMRATYLKHMEFASLLHAKAESMAELGGVELERPPQPLRQFFRATLVAAAVLVLAAIAASYLILPEPPMASVTAGPQSTWSFEAGGISEDNKFLPGTALALEGGTVEVQLSSGSELIVEGPARLFVVNSDTVRMPYGRLWARAGGDKLTVLTNRLKVVDLGTEFGVTASLDLDEEVHVSKGRVRVTPIMNTLKEQELVTGQAIRANIVGSLRTTLFDDRSYQTDLPETVPHLHWSFDDLVEGSYPSEGESLPAASVGMYSFEGRSPALAPAPVPGRFGGALALDGLGFYAQANFQGIEGNLPRTVALWVKSSAVADARMQPLVCWGLPNEFGTKWVVKVRSDLLQMTTGWGHAWAGSDLAPDDLPGQADEWYHLAYVFTGRMDDEGRPEIYHYLNGKLIPLRKPAAAQPVNTDCAAKSSWQLTIGTQLYSDPADSIFTGAIDELYVFRGALGPSQIRMLYEKNSLEAADEVGAEEQIAE